MRHGFTLLALPLLAGGCWVSAQHGDVIDQRLSALEADTKDQHDALGRARRRLDDLIRDVAETRKQLDKLNQGTHASGADLASRLDDLTEKLHELQGELDEALHRVQGIAASQTAESSEMDRKLAAALGSQAMAQLTAKEKAMKLAPPDRAGLFAVAFKQLSGGDSDVARALFEEYLRRYPKDPQAGDAQFYAADSYFKAGQLKQAALGFQRVADQYPRCDKVCDARLELGDSLAGLKMKADAKLAYEDTLRHCGGKLAVAKRAKLAIKKLSPPAKHHRRR